jgi:tRNA threonylcarbamoyladenosine biosynthesis protein TsaE
MRPPTTELIEDAGAMRACGRQVASRLRAGDVVVLTGPLGAGKTTFTQGLAEGLHVGGAVTSPTFVISRVHRSLGDGPDLVHVDAYRLGGLAEVDDLDLDASLDESVTVIEWGSAVAEHLGVEVIEVRIDRDVDASDVRRVWVRWPPGRAHGLRDDGIGTK